MNVHPRKQTMMTKHHSHVIPVIYLLKCIYDTQMVEIRAVELTR